MGRKLQASHGPSLPSFHVTGTWGLDSLAPKLTPSPHPRQFGEELPSMTEPDASNPHGFRSTHTIQIQLLREKKYNTTTIFKIQILRALFLSQTLPNAHFNVRSHIWWISMNYTGEMNWTTSTMWPTHAAWMGTWALPLHFLNISQSESQNDVFGSGGSSDWPVLHNRFLLATQCYPQRPHHVMSHKHWTQAPLGREKNSISGIICQNGDFMVANISLKHTM